jgi:hypothetical protein
MAEKEELTIKIPKDENEKAMLSKQIKEAKEKAAKEKEKEDEDAKCAGCMSLFFCCLVLQ